MIAVYGAYSSIKILYTFNSGKQLAEFFNGYNEGLEGFLYFCKNKFAWRAPNASMLRFEYDPHTGEKIDWKEIYEENKCIFEEHQSKKLE